MVVLDTSVLIDHLRQSSSSASKLMNIAQAEGSKSLAVSVISIQELYEGQSTKQSHKLQQMLSILAPLELLQYDKAVATIAGCLNRDLSTPLGFADAAIAASCIVNHAPLYTLNIKHFKKIPDLELYQI